VTIVHRAKIVPILAATASGADLANRYRRAVGGRPIVCAMTIWPSADAVRLARLDSCSCLMHFAAFTRITADLSAMRVAYSLPAHPRPMQRGTSEG
jgi:hypothetical protein